MSLVSTDTSISQLVLNVLTQAQYNSLVSGGTVQSDQLYFITDSSAKQVYSVTIPTASWTGSDPYTNTVTVNGILASDYPLVQADITTNAEKNAWECIVRGEASANAITFTALNSYPTIDLTATVMVIR